MTQTSGKILYMTDRYKVSQGYEPAFGKLLNRVGIRRQQVVTADIYNLVKNPLRKKANEKTWRVDPEKLPEIQAAFNQRIRVIRPKLIVVSCPAVLGVILNGDIRSATLDKCRGGVYAYDGIPTVITIPITAIHQRIDARLLEGIDETNTQQPYRVPEGGWILQRDWEKVGRFFHDKQRRLPEFQYSVCRTVDDCFAAREWLRDCSIISTDIETGLYPAQITCIGYAGINSKGAVRSFVIPFADQYRESGCFWESDLDHQIAWGVAEEINNFPAAKVLQNGMYDSSYFIKYRLGLENFLFDTMLMWYALYMELPKSLDFISSILLDNFQYWKDDIKGEANESIGRVDNLERYWRYNALDCYYTLFNAMYLMKIMQNNESMRFNYNDVFMRMLSGLRMSMRGVKADFARRDEHREALVESRDKAISRFRYLIADPEFNINSPAQKSSLLYDVLGLKERNAKGRFVDPKKDKKGTNAPSAGAICLKLAKSEHPLFRLIIEAMEAGMEPDKQLSNVFGKIDESTGQVKGGMKLFTDRFRTTLSAAGTETTRFSSKSSNFWDGGNAQNIRATYRDWLVADEGCILMDVDYSQSDDVFVGYESNDPEKIAVAQSGLDAHAVNGELFFKRPYDWIVAGKRAGDPEVIHPITGIRQLSKRIVHGTNFQMAPLTLYITMGRESVIGAAKLLGFNDADSWDQDRLVQVCASLMGAYRRKYKRLSNREWYLEIAKELSAKGTITNAFGITRRFLGDPKDNGTQREATGFIGQSDTAGNMNRAMYEIDHGFIPERFRDGLNPDRLEKPLVMNKESHGFQFLLQIHDSFVIQLDTRHPKWKEAARNVLHVMNRPIIINGHSVRIKTESNFGTRWGKKMLEWDGKDVHDLDRIVTQARSKGI